jgi:5-methylthioadenosine/S-adenosylhomocysteine deaminase
VPDEHLLANLVWGAGARDVRNVWVGGEQVVADREPVKVDREKVQAQAGAVTTRLRAGTR